MIKQKPRPVDIFELRPKQLYLSELVEEGKVVVLVPEYQSKFVKWFLPKKNKTHMRVKLDILGSVVWDYCNGAMTVRDIADRMKAEYGTIAEPIEVRVSSYIKRLHIQRFIEVDKEYEKRQMFYSKTK